MTKRVRSLSRAFDGPACLPGLRRWLREHVEGDEELISRAELVCTELVTNAVDHAGGGGHVRISGEPDELIVEVDDADGRSMLTPGRSRIGTNRGRGLLLIDAVADWGVRRTGAGKTVWAVVSANGA